MAGTVTVAVFVVLAVARGVLEHPWGAVWTIALCAGALSGSSAILANELLDRNPPAFHEARVVARSTSASDPTVTVAGWAGVTGTRELATDRWLHAASPPGTVVCVRQYRGAFGWASVFSAEACPVRELAGG